MFLDNVRYITYMLYVIHVDNHNIELAVLDSVCQFVYRGTPSAVWRTQNNRSAMLIQPACKSACQFVYRETLGVLFVAHETIEVQF